MNTSNVLLNFYFMYLEKLEIQGFKSFANKNLLVFPGMIDKTRRGITAVVGPNGSGKSNVADSIRWVLGEQSMKVLRGKKSEDIIFSGSDKKGKLGMAEVSLYLNNEDRQAPIDYSQVVLTRRLYRDGNSDYLLNNNKVRLSDVQILLAKSKFGQKTYSVIGQGTVEGFLNTSLAERKEFFDEATGVKQYQIKRDDSLNKLRNSFENLSQAEMLINEIEPRLKSLVRQVNRLQRKEEIEKELRGIQLVYYRKLWHELNDKYTQFSSHILELEKDKLEKSKKLEVLNRRLSDMEKQNAVLEEFNSMQKGLNDLQMRKDQMTRELAKVEARIEVKLESSGRFDVSWLTTKKKEINLDNEKFEREIIDILQNIKVEEEKYNEYSAEEKNLNESIEQLNAELKKQMEHNEKKGSGSIFEKIRMIISDIKLLKAEEDPERVKKLIEKIYDDLNNLLESEMEEGQNDKLRKINDDLVQASNAKNRLLSNLNAKKYEIMSLRERQKNIEERMSQTKNQLKDINEKLSAYQGEENKNELTEEHNRQLVELQKMEEEIKEKKEVLGGFSKSIEEKQGQLFNLQKEIQALQNELNNLGNTLNEHRVNATRYETRLENLEAEIRSSFENIKEIRAERFDGEIEVEATEEKIRQLKRQIDQIGGIDPEIEKEYIETKERYDFLFGQTSDLTNAIDSLEKVIKELDMVIKERFDKEFKVISDKFEEYFKILFNGGHAKIIKVLAEEIEAEVTNEKEGTNGNSVENGTAAKPVENASLKKIKYLQKYNATGLAGIEIQATPPGKKIKSIAMLSGGERALTAIALICAIISANPSPFVVLDEVDAALDEANSERLAKILDDLSHKTQFIVITHNRASMRRANILYGITMQDDGVSKLLSVKLDEVKID
jgi:chromosome segregation protein